MAGPIPAEWDIDDNLSAMLARLSPLKIIGVDLLNAAIRVHKVLWPGTEAPKSVGDLARLLQGSEDQLREWRSSCARAGADEALSYVLSWYEALDLDVFQTMRAGSKWTSDPALIQRRRDVASSIAKYASTQALDGGPAYSDGEDEDESEGDAADEEVDEVIQIDDDPARATTNTAEAETDAAKTVAGIETATHISVDESLKSAAAIGAAVVAEITAVVTDTPASPVDPGTGVA